MRKTKPTLIIANGEIGTREERFIKSAEFARIIVADGAWVQARGMGLHPDVVIGDFDSVPPETRIRMGNRVQWVHRPSQERCDLEKALQYCLEKAYLDVIIVGFSGGRIDHTFGNISLLLRYDQSMELSLLTPHSDLFFVRDQRRFRLPIGTTISLIPLANVHGVRTKGLKYALNHEDLILGIREGTSNEVISSSVQISIDSGILMVAVLRAED